MNEVRMGESKMVRNKNSMKKEILISGWKFEIQVKLNILPLILVSSICHSSRKEEDTLLLKFEIKN